MISLSEDCRNHQSQHDAAAKDVSVFRHANDKATNRFYESFAEALFTFLNMPQSSATALREEVAFAESIFARHISSDNHHEQPCQRLMSYLSTWATSLLELMREARSCFDFHHLSHKDEDMLERTPSNIYEEVIE